MKTIVMMCLYVTGTGLLAFCFASLYLSFKWRKDTNDFFKANELSKLAQNQEIK